MCFVFFFIGIDNKSFKVAPRGRASAPGPVHVSGVVGWETEAGPGEKGLGL